MFRQGHASLISEVASSLGPAVKPGGVVLSVGGGGLLCGVVQGLKVVGWTDVPVVAVETVGADCFNAAVKAGRIVTLDDITRSGDRSDFLLSCFSTVSKIELSCFFTVRLNVLVQRLFVKRPLNTARVTVR